MLIISASVWSFKNMSNHASTLAKTHQWLLITFRIKFKLLSIVWKALFDQCPIYPSNLKRHTTLLSLTMLQPHYHSVQWTQIFPTSGLFTRCSFCLGSSTPCFYHLNPWSINRSTIPSKRLSLTLLKVSLVSTTSF